MNGFLALLLLYVSLSLKVSSTFADVVRKSMMHGGLERWFLEIRSPSFRTGNPVLINLHGAGGNMYDANAFPQSLQLSSENSGYMILCPNAINPMNNQTTGPGVWNAYMNLSKFEPRPPDPALAAFQKTDDVGFLVKLANHAIGLGADPKRVYLMGASNGAAMVVRALIDTNPPIYAAAAAFLYQQPILNPEIPKPKSTTPLLLLVGTNDIVVDYNGGIVGEKLGKNAGLAMSANKTKEWWVEANKADLSKPDAKWLPNNNVFDKCRVHSETYPPIDSTKGAPVVFYKVEGGGHSLPSNQYDFWCWAFNYCPGQPSLVVPVCTDMSAVDTAWTFLSQYKLKV